MLFNGLLFVDHVTMLWSTLFNGASHLISFALMLVAIIYGFACVAHSAYGNYIYNFSNTPRDFIVLIDAAFSGLDFYEFYAVNKNFSILVNSKKKKVFLKSIFPFSLFSYMKKINNLILLLLYTVLCRFLLPCVGGSLEHFHCHSLRCLQQSQV